MFGKLLRGTLIMATAAIVVKILSAVYRLPYQNLAGDVGFYVYQQVYPLYAAAVVMAGFGFPSAFVKVMGEARLNKTKLRHVVTAAAVSVSVIGVIIFILIFFSAPVLANLMGDVQLEVPIRIISFSFLFMPVVAVLRGYFQGAFYYMTPTAVSQIVEQCTRVVLIIAFSLVLFYSGAGPYAFGRAAALGSVLAVIIPIVVLLIYIRRTHKKTVFSIPGLREFRVMRRMLSLGLAFTVTSLTAVSFHFIDAMTLVTLLRETGVEQAKAAKGVYDRAFPLIQVGLAVAYALSSSVVPLVAKNKGYERWTEPVREQVQKTLRISFVLGIAATLGLVSVMQSTNIMLFENDKGTFALSIMAINIMVMAFAMTTSTLLQGAGLLWTPVLYLVVGAVVKAFGNFIFVEPLGIAGAAIATVAGAVVYMGLSLAKLLAVFQFNPFRIKMLPKLFICNGLMVILIMSIQALWRKVLGPYDSRMEAAALTFLCVGAGCMINLWLTRKTGLLTHAELSHIPIANKFFKTNI